MQAGIALFLPFWLIAYGYGMSLCVCMYITCHKRLYTLHIILFLDRKISHIGALSAFSFHICVVSHWAGIKCLYNDSIAFDLSLYFSVTKKNLLSACF